MHNDLREWIERAEKIGKLVRICGAQWEKEIAALAELFCHKKRLETPRKGPMAKVAKAHRQPTWVVD